MVPCHGVTVTESLKGADSRDAVWFLLDYQKGKDVPRALVGHIQGGLDELDADENSLLLFSGESGRISLLDPILRSLDWKLRETNKRTLFMCFEVLLPFG